MKPKFLLLLSSLWLAVGGAHAAPLGTAISYQGRLDDRGAPANGTYSFLFRLLADAAGATPIGPVINSPSQVISGGILFTTLDFGAGAFNGDARWLEISVKNGGPGAASTYVKLTPQLLSPGAASQFARLAGDVLNGAVTGAKVAPLAITTTHISDGAITTAKIASGQVVKSISVNGSSNLRDVVNLTAGNNIALTPNGNNVTIASLGGGGAGPWQTLNNNAYYNGGNVGIGISAPTFPLHVNSPSAANTVLAALLEPNLANGGFNQIYLGRSAGAFESATLTYTYHSVSDLNRFSLGLWGRSYMLELAASGRVGVGSGSDLVLSGAESENDLGTFRVEGYGPIDRPPPSPRFVVAKNGNVGIRTGNPAAGLDVRRNWDGEQGTLNLGGNRPSIRFTGDIGSANQSWLIHLGGGAGNLEFYKRTGPGAWRPTMSLVEDGKFLRVEGGGGEAAYLGGDGLGNDIQVGSLNPLVSDIFMYNAGNGTLMHTHVGVLTIHGGADLAEPFPMKEERVDRGSVVVIDEEHPGRLKLSRRAYDTQVAGIVSGANGIRPGIALKQEGALDQGQDVALSGRVYVKADASFGAIKAGDLLTTSDTPGHAMKVKDHGKSQGAILGKAMSALGSGRGLVLVLVTLQ